MSETTALAVRAPQALDPYTPTNIGEAQALAKMYAASKILGAYGTSEQVMLVMATGAELGIAPTAALRSLYLVEGRIFMSADLMVALCLRSPACARFDLSEQSETAAAYTVQRKGGQPLTFRFTLEDAKTAGLGQKEASNWKKYPGTMCRHRAAAIAARAVFPDVILGFSETDEREDVERARDVTPAPVSPLTPAAPAPVADAEIVETDDDAAKRFSDALCAASSEDAGKAIAQEIAKRWPAKDAPHRRALAGIFSTRKAAKWAVEPAHDADGVVAEPGAEG